MTETAVYRQLKETAVYRQLTEAIVTTVATTLASQVLGKDLLSLKSIS